MILNVSLIVLFFLDKVLKEVRIELSIPLLLKWTLSNGSNFLRFCYSSIWRASLNSSVAIWALSGVIKKFRNWGLRLMMFSSFLSSFSQLRNTVNQGKRQNLFGENQFVIVGGMMNWENYALLSHSSSESCPSSSSLVVT